MNICNEEFERWFAERYPREHKFASPSEFKAFKDDAWEIWNAAYTIGQTRLAKLMKESAQ